MCVLPGDRLAMADNNNDCLKIVDVSSGQVAGRLTLPRPPWDVTLVSDDQLAVTVAYQSHVQLINMSPGLSLGNTIPLPGKDYRGLTFSDGQLILACEYPPSVEICDMSGNLLRRVDLDDGGRRLFGLVKRDELFDCPHGVTVSRDGSTIFVTDFGSGQLVSLSRDGRVTGRYNGGWRDKMSSPAGVTTDDRGDVYVCSHRTNTVHRVDGSSDRGEVVLGEEDGSVRPLAIVHHGNRLFVSSFYKSTRSNVLRVFKL